MKRSKHENESTRMVEGTKREGRKKSGGNDCALAIGAVTLFSSRAAALVSLVSTPLAKSEEKERLLVV